MTEQYRIFIVGSNASDNERTVFFLTQALFDARAIADADEAIQECAVSAPDLIILDAGLSSGQTAAADIQKLRAQTDAPLLLLSGMDSVSDRISALEAGADVCMTKPYDARELTAQIHALLRRSSKQEHEQSAPAASAALREGQYAEYPGLLINLSNYTVLYMGKNVETPPKELELFYFLAASPNQVFSREQLLDRLWGFDYMGDTRTVDVHIKRLREKFPATRDWAIRTVWGVGYKFEVKNHKK